MTSRIFRGFISHLGAAMLTALLVVSISGSALAVGVLRGPYLQMATDTAMTLRWRTDDDVVSAVRIGPSPGNWTSTVSEAEATSEHVVALSGLSAGTTYYYEIGYDNGTFQALAGGDANHFFKTSPDPAGPTQTRIWVIGDAGTANPDARAVRDAFKTYTGSRGGDVWLMLGDNAYSSGTDDQYQAAVFNTYPELLRTIPVWPTLGNHDGLSANSGAESGPYYQIFTLPRTTVVGSGAISGTEAYYSFDYGDVHFVVLDSHDTPLTVGGPMLTWLEDDLQSTDRKWVIAYWHHPPYTKGSHDSDNESRLIAMREKVLPILEDYDVDLVLSGHSHSYERSFLIDGHYGSSGSYVAATHAKDGGSGRVGDTGAYQKTLGDIRQGAVYAVVGSSGKTSPGTLDHPAMYISMSRLGSMVIDVDGNELTARFLEPGGIISDWFTINKGGTDEIAALINLIYNILLSDDP